MKTVIFILIICSLIQETIWPADLVLIILICRSMIKTDSANLYLSFAFGLFNSHLSLEPLGLRSLVYLIVIEITQMLSRSRFSSHPLLIIPISLLGLSLSAVVGGIVTNQSMHIFPGVIFESALSLPIFYLVRLWEERFIARKDIKLKV